VEGQNDVRHLLVLLTVSAKGTECLTFCLYRFFEIMRANLRRRKENKRDGHLR